MIQGLFDPLGFPLPKAKHFYYVQNENNFQTANLGDEIFL